MFRHLLVLPVLFGLTSLATAQDQPMPAQPAPAEPQQQQVDRGDDGERGDRGRRWDPAQFRQRMMDGLKEQLKPSDEEWQVLQPAIEKVMTAQRNSRGGFGFGRRGGPGGGAPGGDQQETEVARATRELRTALQNESATAQEIADKLTAFRAARQKAETELTTARTELRDLVTQRQEATLVMMGILE